MSGNILPTTQPWKDTIILRSNEGMIRDCWYDGEYFCIRQIKIEQDGNAAVKMFRLSLDEQREIWTVLDAKMKEPL